MSIGVMVELKVEELASSIKKLSRKDREELLLLLSGEDKEIKKRLREIETGKVKTLTREELLKDVLSGVVPTHTHCVGTRKLYK